MTTLLGEAAVFALGYELAQFPSHAKPPHPPPFSLSLPLSLSARPPLLAQTPHIILLQFRAPASWAPRAPWGRIAHRGGGE